MRRFAKTVLLGSLLILGVVVALKGAALLVPSGSWVPEGTMASARSSAAAALLPDGRILITGGDSGSGPVASADIINVDGTISAAPPMIYARSKHVAVALQDGRILVAGGITAGGSATSSTEIFDPVANSWTNVGAGMTEARSGATALVLQDGRVLIAGGQNGTAISSTIEVFDPAVGTFTPAGMMSSPRTQHGIAALQDGRVLIVGGNNGTAPVASTDIFDPVAGTVSAGPSLAVARFGHSATTLLNGQVVVIGGNNGNAIPSQMDVTPAELFDPTAGTFTTLAANLVTPREGHLAILLPNNNNVLIVGGTSAGMAVPSTELFSQWQGTFAGTGTMAKARSSPTGAANQVNAPTSVMQRNGVVMVAGGTDSSGNALNTTEAYGYPTVQTDQSDYPPGTTVTITGSGFDANEIVTIQLVESPLIDTHGPYTVTADANGNISDSSFTTDPHDENIRFYLTATGSTSGFQAQNTFTDAIHLQSISVGTQTPNPIAPGSSATYSVTGTFNGNGAACNAALSVTTALPTGASAGFNPSSISSVGPTSSTLTISTTSATTPPGSTTFTVKATGSGGCTDTAANTGTLVVVENTTTMLTSSVNPTVFGQSTTLTATVGQTAGPTTPTGGTVTFKDGATTLGTGTLTAGVATLSTSALTVAGSPHSLTASYAGVANTFGASTSDTVTQTVNQASTTTAIARTTGPSPSVFGQSLTFTATVTTVAPGAGTPTGNVTFMDGATTLATVSLTGNTAAFTTTTLAVGGHSLISTYNADANFAGSTSSSLAQTVNQASTTSTITAHTPSPSVVGQAVSITFTVTANSPGSGTPTGNVTVSDGLGDSCTATVALGTCSITFPAAGAKTLSAVYAGDTNFTGSTSANVSQTVNAASTTTTITAHIPNPSVIGQPITLNFTVTVNAPGSGTIPGTDNVTVSDGTGDSCTGTVTSGTCQLTPTTSGTKTLTATFAGDTNFATSTSAGVSQTVNKRATSTSVSLSLSTVVVGQPSSATVTVTDIDSGTQTNPTGTVTLSSSDVGDSFGTCTLTPSDGNAATCTASVTPSKVGTSPHTITATFPTDATHATSTGTASLTVNKASTTTTITSNTPNPSTVGQAITVNYSATVTSPGAGTPTGNVTVSDGAGDSCTATVAAGTCQITIGTAGGKTLTATYAGDTNFNTSASAGTSQTVNPKLAFTTTTFATLTGVCSPQLSVQTQNANGSAANQTPGITLNLSSSSGTGKFFSDSACSTQITSAQIAAGSSTASFFYADSTIGSPVTTVASSGLTSVTQAETVTGLRFGTTAFSVQVSTCSSAISLQSANSASGSPTSLTQATTINLSSTSAGGNFYSDSACTMQITSITISPAIDAGHDSSSFFYKDTSAGGPMLTGSAGTASATQTESVVTPPTINNAFGAATIAVNGITSLTLTITNPAANTVALNGVAVTDTFPSGLVVATPNALNDTCGGTATANPGSGSVNLSGGTVAVNASCTITVNVTGTASGVKNNTTAAVTSTNGGAGNTASASLTVASPPTITKAFGASSIPFNGSTGLSFTINNPNTISLSGVAFTDALPAGISVANPNNLISTCGGTTTATAGSGSISLSAGSVAASSSCTISVNVTGTSLGLKTNTTGAITATESGSGATSNTVSLTVNQASTTTAVTLSASTIAFGQSTTVTAIVNPQFTGTPSGSVTVSDSLGGAGDSCTITLASGTGMCTLTPSAASPSGLTVTGTYSGDTDFTGSFGTAALTVNKATAAVILSNLTQTYTGSPVSPTVTTTPTGLSFSLTGAPDINAGSYPVTATVNDPNYQGGASGTFTINQAIAVVMLSNLNQNYDGTPKSVTVVTSPLGLSVMVTYDGSGTPPTDAGSYTVSASVVDANYQGGALATLLINAATTSTAVSSSKNPSNYGDSVSFVGTVSSTVGTPTGTVQFVLDGSNFGSPVTLSIGTATSTATTTLAAGQHTVTAVYSGTTDFTGSTSPFLIQTVDNALTSIAVTPATPSMFVGGTQQFTATGKFADGSSAILPAGGTWAIGNSLTSAVRAPMAAAGSNGTLYFFGGQDGGGAENFTQTYSPATGVFGSGTVVPTPRYQGSAVAPGDGKIYVIGGWNGSLPTNTVEAYDPVANTWTSKTSIGHPSACSVGGAINGKIYVVTGCNGSSGYFGLLDVYDPVANTWTSLSPAPNAHGAGAGGVINGKLYVVGGYNSTGSAVTETLDVYDPQSNSWSTSVPMTTPLAELSGSVIGSKLYIVGGMDISSNPQSSVYIYDAVANTWSTGPSLAQGRRDIGLATNDGLLYAGGGFTTSNSKALEILDTDIVTWASDTTSVATIDPNSGLATGIDAGTANISATSATFSISGTTLLTVNKADTLSAVTSSNNPSVYGQPVMFTATVSDISANSTGTPTGSVTFMDGATTLVAGVALSGGQATFTTSALGAATHSITAVYSGDSNFNATNFDAGSTATPLTQMVQRAPLTVLLTAANKTYDGTTTEPNANMSCTLMGVLAGDTANVSCAATSGTFNTSQVATANLVTATVTISGNAVGNYTLGTAGTTLGSTSATASAQITARLITIKATSMSRVFGNSTPAFSIFVSVGSLASVDTLTSLGTPTFTTSPTNPAVNAGSYTIAVSGLVNTNYAIGYDNTGALTITQAPTMTTVGSSGNPSTLGQAVTFTATVANTQTPPIPTGSVQFQIDGVNFGAAVALSAGGTASVSTSTLSVGSHAVVAVFTNADGNFVGSTSSTLTQQVNFGFVGFGPPYAPPPTTFNVTRTMPLIWEYTNSSGAVVNSSAANPVIIINGPYTCGGSDSAGTITVDDAGASGYQYDPGSNSWQFNWQIKGNVVGCYDIYVKSQQSGQTNGAFPISVVNK